MRRQLLDPVGGMPIIEVVRRLCGVQTQVASSAELAIRVRRQTSDAGEVARELVAGGLVKTWAMRGALHLLTPEDGGAFLSLMAAGRSWHRGSWQKTFGMTPTQMDRLRDAVREVLDGGAVLTREDLVAAVIGKPGLEHAGDALRSGWGTLLKPLAWQGDVCFGPSQGQRVTFMLPAAASSSWNGVPPPEDAAPVAITAYFGAYGPATMDLFNQFMSGGWFGKRQLAAWLDPLRDRLVEVEVDGESAHMLAEHVDELATTEPTSVVRLLAGFDQYVLGPGTADGHVTPAARRSAVSKQSGWIAPVVVAGGVVTGTWALDDDEVRIAWLTEAGAVPRRWLDTEVQRLGAILDRPLVAVIAPS